MHKTQGSVRAQIEITTEGDEALVDAIGSHTIPSSWARWETTSGLGTGLSAQKLSARDYERRHLFGHKSTLAAVTLKLNHWGQGGFDWDGGVPDTYIDMCDYPDGVFSEDVVYAVDIRTIWIVTTRIHPHPPDQPQKTVVSWLWCEGQWEDELLKHDGILRR